MSCAVNWSAKHSCIAKLAKNKTIPENKSSMHGLHGDYTWLLQNINSNIMYISTGGSYCYNQHLIFTVRPSHAQILLATVSNPPSSPMMHQK